MLTNFIFKTDEEALALKKGADRAISSKVNRTSVVLPFMEWQSSHNLVFYFANENKKLTKKGKKEEKDNDVPPKKGKRSHTIRRGVYHRIFISIYVIL